MSTIGLITRSQFHLCTFVFIFGGGLSGIGEISLIMITLDIHPLLMPEFAGATYLALAYLAAGNVIMLVEILMRGFHLSGS